MSSETATASTSTIPTNPEQDTPLFTCLSCQIAFPNPEDQRTHYRSDLHRYNMKRRVANLPPVKTAVFNEKVLAQRKAAGMMLPTGNVAPGGDLQQRADQMEPEDQEKKVEHGNRCDACSKSFSSSNIYRDHVASRKHKETVLKASKLSSNAGASTSKRTVEEGAIPLVFHIPGQKPTTATEALENLDSLKDSLPNSAAEASSIPEPIKTSEIQAQASSSSTNQEENENTRNAAKANLLVPANATEEDIKHAIDAKIASSVRINPNTTCLFCAIKVDDLESNIEHMRKSHGFFLPEQDYLIDLNGLMGYLADKISVGNICLYCNGRGRAFNELNAVRKHMLDKSHCKIAYDDEEDRLELSDFYNFESSYPVDSDEEWEDEDDEDAEVDEEGELINQTKKRSSNKGNGIRYGDSEFELILPSGNRLGHRSLRRYYQQTLWQTPATHLSQQERARNGDWNVNVAEGTGTLARRIAAGRPGAGRGGLDEEVGGDDADANNGGLVVRDRNGMQVRARNRGEAKEAVRHTREFRDRDRKEQFKTKAMYRNNNQKHFRDHLLQ